MMSSERVQCVACVGGEKRGEACEACEAFEASHVPVALSRPFSHPSSMLMRTYPSLVNPLEMKYSVTFWMCASVSQHQLESKERWGKRGASDDHHYKHKVKRKLSYIVQ